MHIKRIYLKPIVEVVGIDSSISFAMASLGDGTSGPPDPMIAQPIQQKNPFDSNAFSSTPAKKK